MHKLNLSFTGSLEILSPSYQIVSNQICVEGASHLLSGLVPVYSNNQITHVAFLTSYTLPTVNPENVTFADIMSMIPGFSYVSSKVGPPNGGITFNTNTSDLELTVFISVPPGNPPSLPYTVAALWLNGDVDLYDTSVYIPNGYEKLLAITAIAPVNKSSFLPLDAQWHLRFRVVIP